MLKAHILLFFLSPKEMSPLVWIFVHASLKLSYFIDREKGLHFWTTTTPGISAPRAGRLLKRGKVSLASGCTEGAMTFVHPTFFTGHSL